MVKKQKTSKEGVAPTTPKTKSPVKKIASSAPTVADEDVQEAEMKRARLEENMWNIEKQVLEHSHPIVPSASFKHS